MDNQFLYIVNDYSSADSETDSMMSEDEGPGSRKEEMKSVHNSLKILHCLCLDLFEFYGISFNSHLLYSHSS